MTELVQINNSIQTGFVRRRGLCDGRTGCLVLSDEGRSP